MCFPTQASKMPRSQPLDPKIRQKYNSELTAVENVLEELYNDPLKVWQEMVTNPDKFGGRLEHAYTHTHKQT